MHFTKEHYQPSQDIEDGIICGNSERLIGVNYSGRKPHL